MVVKKCIECGNDVSSEADACPHCGAPGLQRRTEKLIKDLFALLILIPVAWFLLTKC
jgi:RNA polymerase subunit RPABC4/transcription elongation factor Spt4